MIAWPSGPVVIVGGSIYGQYRAMPRAFNRLDRLDRSAEEVSGLGLALKVGVRTGQCYMHPNLA
jgi:hypothetical protein